MNAAQKESILQQLRRDACRIAEHFNLEYRDIHAESSQVKRRYGVCYEDGLIKIRLFHVRTRESLKYSGLVATLCHELAHLKHFDHGPQFKKFYWRLLNWARLQQIYQPDSPRGRPRGRPGGGARTGYRPRRRNGVPVFPGQDDKPYRPPWEKEPKPRARAAPRPPPAQKPEPEKERTSPPKQLTLF